MAGLALSSLLSAASDALVTLWPDALLDRSTFSIGGFGSVTMASCLLYTSAYLQLGRLESKEYRAAAGDRP